jgi:hypothetical protein
MTRGGKTQSDLAFNDIARQGFADAILDSDTINRQVRAHHLIEIIMSLEESDDYQVIPTETDIILSLALKENDPAEEVERFIEAIVPYFVSSSSPKLAGRMEAWIVFSKCRLLGPSQTFIEIDTSIAEDVIASACQAVKKEIEKKREEGGDIFPLSQFADTAEISATLRASQIASSLLMEKTKERRFETLFGYDPARFQAIDLTNAFIHLKEAIIEEVGQPDEIKWPTEEDLAEIIRESCQDNLPSPVDLQAALVMQCWPKAAKAFISNGDFDENSSNAYRQLLEAWKRWTPATRSATL